MPIVSEIMSTNVRFISEHANLREARTALKEQNVRHLPVVSDEDELVGLLTQRVVLAEVIKLVDQVGVRGLERREHQHQVREIMETDFHVTAPDMDLKTAGQHFIEHKHSCLPVINEGRLVGMLTAQDFVRLIVSML